MGLGEITAIIESIRADIPKMSLKELKKAKDIIEQTIELYQKTLGSIEKRLDALESECLGRCWLCGHAGANETIKVSCETPGGKPCKTKEVPVHYGCYMDMDT